MDQEAGTALIKCVLLKYNQERTICVHGHGVIGAPSTVVPLQKGKTGVSRLEEGRAHKIRKTQVQRLVQFKSPVH